MTHLFRTRVLCTFFSAVAAVSLVSCSDDDTTGPGTEVDYSQYLEDFSQKVAVATYNDMKAKGADLNTAVQAWAADPSNQSKLDAAAQAWRAMREPWEASEGFLFGPVSFLAIDPSLDSWPVDRQQLDNVLASDVELTPTAVKALNEGLRGFHTAEYLIFRDGGVRNVAEITERERQYLTATVQVLADDAATLADAWTTGGYADEFANAGEQGSRYTTQTDAMTEIVEGMIGICDEVANGKIAGPYDEQDTRLVESQFSWNSLADFQNNMRSVQNAYNGGYHKGEDGKGLNEFVASKDAALDTRIQAEIQGAIDAIGAIPAPFRDNLDASTEIEAAQRAIQKVAVTLQEDVLPLITN